MEPSDAQLLVWTCRGDETAARLVWLRHSGPLLAYARTILGSSQRHHADDVVQSVMLAILRASPRKLAKVVDGRLWLATLARRQCLNVLRSVGREGRKRSASVHSTPSETGDSPPSTDLTPQLAAALDSLPRRLREVVVLKHISLLTFDQIALSLDRNRSTLASQYQVGMEQLRELVLHQNRTISRDGAASGSVGESRSSPGQSAPHPSLGART